MNRKERRAATRKEAKEDKKDLESILRSLVERFGSEKGAVIGCIEYLIFIANTAGFVSSNFIHDKVIEFLSNEKTEDRDNQSTVQIPKED